MFIGHSDTEKEAIRKIVCKRGSKIHFIGVGGISMSSLAMMAAERGLSVSGSDVRRTEVTDMLSANGITVRYSHSKAMIMSIMPDLVVYSLSISEVNPEYAMARSLGIPTVSRAELLGSLMNEYEVPIGVSGSHGKSTVTAMLGRALEYAELNPSILCGAELRNGLGYISGERDYLVYESCEYGDSFLRFSPQIQILLNLDLDHTDYFENERALEASFVRAANLAATACIVNSDSVNLREILPKITVPVYTFAENGGADYIYKITAENRGKYSFDLYCGDNRIESFSLGIAGRFNVSNAVSVIIACEIIGIPIGVTKRAIADFSGIPRRLEFIGKHLGGDVYYDYAHHPCEINSVRKTLCEMGYERIAVIFAPHTYSRTKAFFSDFAEALAGFSRAFVTEIYGARETAVTGISSSSLSEAIRSVGGISYAVSREEALSRIDEGAFDCLVLMGAGDIETLKQRIEKM